MQTFPITFDDPHRIASTHEQGTHTWHLVFATGNRGPMGGATFEEFSGTCTPPQGATRHDVLDALRQAAERHAPIGAVLISRDIQPNSL